MLLPSFSGLTAFYAAVRNGTLTGAAAELNVSQPAISRRIAALEADLGCRLFDRTHKPARLTEEGRVLLLALRSGFGQIEQAVDVLRQGVSKQTITISGPSGFVAFWLIPRLEDLKVAFPALTIRIMSHEQGEAMPTAEVSVRFGLPDPALPSETRILSEDVFPVANPLYLARKGMSASDVDYASLVLLTMQSGRRHWYDWPAWLEAAGKPKLESAQFMDFNNYAMLVNAAMAGQGVCLSWAGLLDSFLESGALVRIAGPSVTSQRGYFVAARDGHAARPDVIAVLGWIQSHDGLGT
ncbi:LysR family transcriptional regulator [Pseudorhodobacter ferrugineus]|uniref:LysR family transcriptional regulator n=1 Tax=Pseudorhodobacter ferrugineus TaxID=77008 RepID=UPI0003B2E513|nr:LysR family transcriptional regulator [Pseudorhodobacter ferrugineus]